MDFSQDDTVSIAATRLVLGIEDRFDLLERIGEGGMALVYRARQKVPVTRIVALKLVKLGMDTLELLRRFELEQQTLAQLDHPHIARMYDAGATATGRPYFVMEFVDGKNLLEFSRSQALSVSQRIELMIVICRAIQFAHQRGVIHRDLKPSNLLVKSEEGKSVPKVIDFGVSRAMSSDSSQMTLTAAQSTLGTPAYMSPEQLRDSHAVDTRSDLYSLGVVCCELFWGVLPFDLDQSGRPRTAVETRIERPSTRFAHTEKARGPLKDVGIRGELDWIIIKCLEYRREDRYQSAAELADDLERYLRGEPTRAAPPSRVRQLRWFMQRHKAAVATTVAVVAVLMATLAGTSYGLIREKRIAAELARQKTEAETQRAEADRRRAEAEESQRTVEDVNIYLTGIFRQANPQFNPTWRKDLTLRDALDNIAKMLASDLAQQKAVRAEVCETISQAYVSLGEAEKGLSLAKLALEIREKTLGSQHPKTNSARFNLGYLLHGMDRIDEAAPLLEQSLEFTRRRYGPDSTTTLAEMHGLGLLRLDQKRYSEAEPILRDTLERKRRVLGPDSGSTLVTANVLATLLQNTNRNAEAEPIARATFESREKIFGRDHPATLFSMVNLSTILFSLNHDEEAIRLVDDGLARAVRLFGNDHNATRGFVRNRGVYLIRSGSRQEAIEYVKSFGHDPAVLDRYQNAATQPVPASAPAMKG